MPSSALSSPGALQARIHRWVVVTVLGFASGLPLALTGQAMQAWLSTSGVDIAQIGFLAIVGLPYTFKFLWAPLMDRFELWPGLGRRRGGRSTSMRKIRVCGTVTAVIRGVNQHCWHADSSRPGSGW